MATAMATALDRFPPNGHGHGMTAMAMAMARPRTTGLPERAVHLEL
jgi:hypothetical protein